MNNKKIDILYILRVFISYWPLFFISCLIFIFAAIFYLKNTTRSYLVYSKILVHSSQMNTRSSNTYVNVEDLMYQNNNRTNELKNMISSPFIKKAINDLNLNISYYAKDKKLPSELNFGLQNIYKSNPFTVIINKNEPQPLSLFYIRIIDDTKYAIYAENENTSLYDYYADKLSSQKNIYFKLSGVHEFGQTVQNDYCSFTIILNSNYSPESFIGKELYFRFNNPTSLSYAIQKKISIKSNFYESSEATISFESNNLELSMDFLSLLIEKQIKLNLETKNYDADKTIEYINEQLASVSGELGKTENQLQNFQNRGEVINIDEKFKGLLGEMEELELEKEQYLSNIQNMRRLRSYFEGDLNSQTFIAPSAAGMNDETLSALILELTTLSRERKSLIDTKQLKNPRLKTLNTNIESIVKVITENIDFDLKTAESQLEEVNNKIRKITREYSSLPQMQKQLRELERNFNINDDVYTALLNRRMQAKIIKASNRPDIEIVEPVRFDMMTSPSLMKTAVIFLFLAFFFPSIYIVLVNFLTPLVKTKEDISYYNKLPIIGEIPHSSKNSPNLVANFPQDPIVERFHALRSNIIYYLLGNLNQTILITSTLPNEGKSFSSLNLALSFSAANYKTLLIAFDLRKNSNTFNELKTNTLIGIDSYLINRASIEDIIATTEYENLHFICNIEIPPNPSALLSSPKIKELLDTVKSYYDYVIIDTPPFGLVSDAFLLMQHVDISIYIARLGTVTKTALKHNMDDINTKTNNTYLVINDLTKLDKPYYGKYNYGETKKKNFFQKIFRLKRG